MAETVAFSSTVHSSKKVMIMLAPALSSAFVGQCIALDSSIRMSRSACHDALSLSISNEHQATTDMFIVFVGDRKRMSVLLSGER